MTFEMRTEKFIQQHYFLLKNRKTFKELLVCLREIFKLEVDQVYLNKKSYQCSDIPVQRNSCLSITITVIFAFECCTMRHGEYSETDKNCD